MIYKGEKAIHILQNALEDRKSILSKGYFFEENIWVAFDNSRGNCWVEEFLKEEKAICWLENFFEISEIENFEIIKLSNELIFIPRVGYLIINFENDLVTTKFHPLST